jgi:hypothetical protein
MAVTPVIRGTQAQVSWQSAELKVGNQLDSKLAISRIQSWQSAGLKLAIKIQLGSQTGTE